MSARLTALSLLATLVASHAMASSGVPSGIFRGEHGEKQTLIIKEVSSARSSTSYAMLSLGGNDRQTGLFKIEPVDESTLQLTRLYISSQSILTTSPDSQPSFSAQLATDKNGDSVMVLTATPTGRSSGCPTSLRFNVDRSARQSWSSFSKFDASRLRINRDSELDMLMGKSGPVKEYSVTLTGADDLRADWAGQYLVTEQIDGIGLMRRRQLDSTSPSGFSLSRGIDSVLVPMTSDSGRPSLRFVRMGAGDNSCLSQSSTIK